MGKTINMVIPKRQEIGLNIKSKKGVNLSFNKQIGSSNYNTLTNKPKINDITLIDNKTSEELGLQSKMDNITPQDIDKIIFG